jgi:hypothetical protein
MKKSTVKVPRKKGNRIRRTWNSAVDKISDKEFEAVLYVFWNLRGYSDEEFYKITNAEWNARFRRYERKQIKLGPLTMIKPAIIEAFREMKGRYPKMQEFEGILERWQALTDEERNKMRIGPSISSEHYNRVRIPALR